MGVRYPKVVKKTNIPQSMRIMLNEIRLFIEQFQAQKPDYQISFFLLLCGLILLPVAFVKNIGHGLALVLILIPIIYLNSIQESNFYNLAQKRDNSKDSIYVTILTILFFIIFLLSIWFSHHSYGRPVFVFFLIEFLFITMIIEAIVFNINNKISEYNFLFQAIILCLTLGFTSGLTYDYLGSDMFTHLVHIESIINMGSNFTLSGAYSNYPLFQDTCAIFSIVSCITLGQSLLVIGLMGPCIGLLFLYIIVKKMFCPFVAVFALLLLLSNKYFLFWIANPLPYSVIIGVIIIFEYLILKHISNFSINRNYILIFLVFILLLPFLHPLGSILGLLLILLIPGIVMISKILCHIPILQNKNFYCFTLISKIQYHFSSLILLALILFLTTIFNWTFLGVTFTNAISELISNLNVTSSSGLVPLSSQKDVIYYEIESINLYLLYILAGLGILTHIKNNINSYKYINYTFIIAGAITFIIGGYLFWVFGINFVPHRVILVGIIFLVVPAAVYSYNKLTNKTNVVVLIIVIAAISITGVIGNEYNVDQPFYYGKQLTVYNLKSSEFYSLNFASERILDLNTDFNKQQNNIEYGVTTDWETVQYLEYQVQNQFGSGVHIVTRHKWREEGFVVYTTHFIIRDIYFDRRLFPDKPLPRSIVSKLDNMKPLNRIYENNEVGIYYQPEPPTYLY